MYIGAYGWYNTAGFTESNNKIAEARKTATGSSTSASVGVIAGETDIDQTKWEERMEKWDKEMERIKEENERYSEWLEERRKQQKIKQKKLRDKKALKEYLARQDEISQLNERLSLQRAMGEDVYIEKAPLSKSLGVAELLDLL